MDFSYLRLRSVLTGSIYTMICLSILGCRDRDSMQQSAERQNLAVRPVVAVSSINPSNSDFGRQHQLPLPSTMAVFDYEKQLFKFLSERQYVELGWRKDKTVRDTGPYIDGTYYGTHPAVRVFYSPGITRWLAEGRVGPIADGEMIIKEQYAPPAILHRDKSEAELRDSLESWTVMIKDSTGSHDGWFWSNPSADAEPFDYHAKNEQPYSGFGLYCVRCHASAQSPGVESPADMANEFTFASLRNIEGFPGQPILFRVDDSWQAAADQEADDEASGGDTDATETSKVAKATADQAFTALYDSIKSIPLQSIDCLPRSSHDSVPSSRYQAKQFFTSNQCMNCHAGLTGPLGPVGYVHMDSATNEYGGDGVNVSPYGEWRWTPMGLAGRDPIFYAQLESEISLIRQQFGEGDESRQISETLIDTCFRCHGPMGYHQRRSQHGDVEKISMADVHGDSEIGALARDGVSCMVCHRIKPPAQPEDDQRPYLQYFLETSTTGNLHLGPPGELYGPYKDNEVAGYAMHHATGWKPVHSDYLKKSQLCGTCHTVSLPTIDRPLGDDDSGPLVDPLTDAESVPEFKRFHHHIEQATYLEWLNSQFNNETDPDAVHGRSCQDCHMPSKVFADENNGAEEPVRTRIAAIQDTTYPDAENLAEHKQLDIPIRDEYRRHGFAGLNVWLLELTKQFDQQVGVKQQDLMTGSTRGAEQAIAGMVRTARHETASIKLDIVPESTTTSNTLDAKVTVTNLAGHRFPTGVGFRRAFIEMTVFTTDEQGNESIVWSSGKTNELGVILGDDGQPLETEFFAGDVPDESHQPHHEVITSQNQVQIYETLLKDNFGRFTTSFVRGCESVKDNRLLPKGWSAKGPGGGLDGPYLKATLPGPIAMQDSDFTDGNGHDIVHYQIALPANVDRDEIRVRASLYYQALPPYYLRNLFKTSPDGGATQLLHQMTSRLQFKNSPIQDWKLLIDRQETSLVGLETSLEGSDHTSTPASAAAPK
ncbi:hypothetical protein [Novipirellula caenicola]|uniref:Cytochrome c-552/4 domain-containing protein n=1 Tax=Novipirellula caenicola TaxID=1536901 RepID=A0ABP9W341_9BACT